MEEAPFLSLYRQRQSNVLCILKIHESPVYVRKFFYNLQLSNPRHVMTLPCHPFNQFVYVYMYVLVLLA